MPILPNLDATFFNQHTGMIRYIFLFAFSLVLLSCGESTSESQADEAATSGLGDLTNEVMEVHDEAMAKMGEVQQLMQAS